MVDKRAQQVRRMFASVAHRYDLLNRLLSLSVDRHWRRVTRQKLLAETRSNPAILDVCTGTGDLALELSSQARIIGCDFCRPMLVRGAEKTQKRGRGAEISFLEADALALPLVEKCFDAVTIAFGLRNLENVQDGLAEMYRVLRDGGWLAILEFSLPTLPVLRQIYLFYFIHILPRIGAVFSGREDPYSYLPESVREFPTPEELQRILARMGFGSLHTFSLTFKIATLYLAQKRPRS